MIYHADVSIQYDRDRIFRRLRIEAGTNVHHYAAASFPALAEIAEPACRWSTPTPFRKIFSRWASRRWTPAPIWSPVSPPAQRKLCPQSADCWRWE